MLDELTRQILVRLDEPPTVRPGFADALRLELHRELGFAAAAPVTETAGAATRPAAAQRPRGRHWPSWRTVLPSFRPLTVRTVLLTALALLLVACTALAVYEVTRAWLRVGDRGPQYTSDFWLAQVYSEPDSLYSDLHLAPDGQALIGLRPPYPKPWGSSQFDPRDWAIVRIPLNGAHAAATVMPLEDLRRAVRWDPGVATDEGFVQRSVASSVGDALSVASNGDIFTSVSLGPDGDGAIPSSSALVVIHPDSSAQTIVTVRELGAAGLLPPVAGARSRGVVGVASAPDRLWVRAEAYADDGSWTKGSWLLEIVDPNADGDWSDRVIHPVVLPVSVPASPFGTYEWRDAGLVAEPSTPGTDRSHSILVGMVSQDSEYRLYRLTDPDGDGVVSGPGESELLVSQVGTFDLNVFRPTVSARLVAGTDGIVAEELVLGRISRASRVSRVTPNGLEDILRGLPTNVESVHGTSDGSILVTSQVEATSESGWAWVVYELMPAAPGTTPPPGALSPMPSSVGPGASAASPAASEGWATGPITPGVSQLLFRVGDPVKPRQLILGSDGSGPAELLAGRYPQNLCLSTDGAKVAFVSDAEVPNDFFVYVADIGGTHVEKMSEAYNGFECPFTSDAIVLSREQRLYVRHDLHTGVETTILDDRVGFISPDGRTLVAEQTECFGTACFNTRLILIDVATGAQRVLERHVEGEVFGSAWSPDGRLIAYPVVHRVTQPININEDVAEVPTDIDLYVADVDTGLSRRLTTIHGLVPDFSWSADGSILTALIPSVTYRTNGTYTIVSVNVVTGAVTTLADTGAKWAAWSPTDPTAFAYVTMDGLFVIDDGTTRTLVAKTPTGGETGDEAVRPFVVGWSPDGKLFGHVEHGAISVVDVATGVETPIWRAPSGVVSGYPWWWR